MDPAGVMVVYGSHDALDLIVRAPGFRRVQSRHRKPFYFWNYSFNGTTLAELWSDVASAHDDIPMEKLPDFGMLYGPNNSLAYNSLVVRIEAYPLYVSHVVTAVLDADCYCKTLRLEQKHDTVKAYKQDIQIKLARSTYVNRSCMSWIMAK